MTVHTSICRVEVVLMISENTIRTALHKRCNIFISHVQAYGDCKTDSKDTTNSVRTEGLGCNTVNPKRSFWSPAESIYLGDQLKERVFVNFWWKYVTHKFLVSKIDQSSNFPKLLKSVLVSVFKFSTVATNLPVILWVFSIANSHHQPDMSATSYTLFCYPTTQQKTTCPKFW